MSTEFYNRNWRMPNSWNGSEDNNDKFSNYSMSFDGSSERITVPYNTLLDQSLYSISVWIKNDVTTTGDKGILCADSSTRGWALQQNGTDLKFDSNISGGGGQVKDTDFFNTTNTWIHCVVTFDGTTSTMYKNGVSAATNTNSNNILNANNNSLTIGDNPQGTKEFAGKLDHCCIFDYALTQAQVTALYGSSSTGVGNPMAITNGRKPVAYYPIGDYSAYNGTEYLVPNSAVSDYVFDFVPLDYITIPDSDLFSFGDGTNDSPFSISAWINVDDTSTNRIVSKATAGNPEYLFTTGTGSKTLVLNMYDKLATTSGPYRGKAGTTSFNSYIGKWVHAVATYDGRGGNDAYDGINLYFNGVLETTTNLTDGTYEAMQNTSSPVQIGADPTWTSIYMNGQISNVSIFNIELPATGTESIASLYNYGTPPDISSYSGLQGFWKLDASATFDGSNFSIPDDSSNSNTGTSSGMTAANLVQSTLLITQPYSRYALSFDGTNDQIVTGITNTGTDVNVSLSCWINTTTNISSRQSPFGGVNNTTAGSNSYTLGVVSPSGTNTKVRAFNTLGSTTLNDGNWHNIIYTYEYSTKDVKIYVDGNTTPEVSVTFPNYLTTYQILIGGFSLGGMFFSGSISNCSLWNNVLTSSQVTEIYNQGKPSNLNNHSAYSNLVSWWQLGENMSYDSNVWTVLDEKGTNNGTGANLAPAEDSIVNGVGTSGNGLSDGMGGADNIVGDAPYSTANAVSYGMGVDAKSTDVPS